MVYYRTANYKPCILILDAGYNYKMFMASDANALDMDISASTCPNDSFLLRLEEYSTFPE